MKQRGASFIELMIAIGIMAALLAGGEPLVAAAMRAKAKAAEVDVASELRMARHIAAQRREKVRVLFDRPSGQIRTEIMQSGTILREYNVAAHGMTVESLTNGDTVLFYPSGRAASPTTITLKRPSGERRYLTVSITGRVTASW